MNEQLMITSIATIIKVCNIKSIILIYTRLSVLRRAELIMIFSCFLCSVVCPTS